MQDTRIKRAALYTRVSTEEQAAEGFSLDAQMRRLELYCEMEGWTVAGRYREEGHSGRNTKRPEYQRMMSEREQWDVVLVLKMDRIHRNSVNFTGMMTDLESWGKNFCSVQEQFDTETAMGRFVMDLMQRIAQLESEQIGERVKIGMEQKAKKGKLLGSAHPYGYEFIRGQWCVVDDEMYVVRAIFNMSRMNYTMEYIANSLNDAGVPTKKGGKWKRQTISGILHNMRYAGYVKWGDTVRECTDNCAIITRETFEAVNGPINQVFI